VHAASSPPLLPVHFVFSDEPIVGGGQTCQQALECQKKINAKFPAFFSYIVPGGVIPVHWIADHLNPILFKIMAQRRGEQCGAARLPARIRHVLNFATNFPDLHIQMRQICACHYG
jgi:hypothetical protein